MTRNEYLDSLTKEDCLVIIKYGLRETCAPPDVNVEDVYHMIGSFYINGE